MELAGYIGAVLIGLALGLIGGGGSILTVPVLVYLFAIAPVMATAYSLFIVGTASLIGSVNCMRHKHVHFKMAIVFGIPSIIAVYLTRHYLVPWLPDELFQIGKFVVTKDIGMMLLFALLMIPAAWSMIRKRKGADEGEEGRMVHMPNIPLVILEGIVVGTLTGLVGAGGGFLIIPALVVLTGMPMKQAIGTSLLIIAVKSLIGFTGDLGAGMNVDWGFLALFTGLSVLGILIGTYLSRFISGAKLKPAFGYFVLVMGVFIIIMELVIQ